MGGVNLFMFPWGVIKESKKFISLISKFKKQGFLQITSI